MTFALAFAIGFSVASIPGPIIILVATEALRKGARAGLMTMIAPVLIDASIMVPAGLFLQTSLFSGKGLALSSAEGALVLGWIGGGVLVVLGIQSIRSSPGSIQDVDPGGAISGRKEIPPFLKGALSQLTSPYPYLYWGTAGATFIRQGFERGGLLGATLFPIGFWLGTTTFTLIVIYVVAGGRRFISSRLEPPLRILSGLLLIGSGIFLALRVWQRSF